MLGELKPVKNLSPMCCFLWEMMVNFQIMFYLLVLQLEIIFRVLQN